MKRFVLFTLSIGFYLQVHSQTNVWIGGAAGNWSLTTNWSLGHTPTPAEDVEIGITCNINVNTFASGFRDINSLKLTGVGITVTLGCTSNATRSLRISSTSSTTKGLVIPAGTTLIFDATNTTGTGNWICDMTGSNGVTGLIDGTLQFAGTGSATGTTHLNVYSGAGQSANLVVSSTGSIIYSTDSGDTSPSAGIASYLTMQNGSTYEIAKGNGTFPEATWQSTSLCKATSPATTVPGFVDGVTYGNLEWNCFAQNAADLNVSVTFNNVNIISTQDLALRVTGTALGNHTITINGNLDISNDGFLELVGNTAPASSSGKVILKGHLNNQGVFTTNGISGTISQFELQGSVNQNITGQLSGVSLEFIMNGFSSTLQNSLFLPGNNNAAGANLQLINGKIITTSSYFLDMVDNATVSGGSNTSYVEGKMRKNGDDAFKFPIGEGNDYAPIEISAGAASTFTAQYFRGRPDLAYGSNIDKITIVPSPTSPIDHISGLEYWSLVRSSFSSRNVTLYNRTYSGVTLLSQLVVARWNSGSVRWENEGQSANSGGIVFGSVTSFNAISGFAAFTLASTSAFPNNPLPINLITFDATKLSNTKSSIDWELAACCSSAAKFEVQRANADKIFVTVGTVNGNETNKVYNLVDNDLKKGVSYYRLKMIDVDGKITYSRVVAVMNGVDGLLLTSLVPTVINNSATLTISSSSAKKMDLVIVDMQGRVMQKQNYSISAGNTSIAINTDRLGNGIYQLFGVTGEGRTNLIRFIKQ